MFINSSQIGAVRFLLIVFCSAVVFPWNGYAQSINTDRKTYIFPTFKFAEIGEMPREQWERELIKFADASRDYLGSRVRIFVYAAAGTQRTSIDSIREQYGDFLKKTLGESISTGVWPGGYRKNFTAELWIVGKDDWPAPTPDEQFKPEQFGEIGDVSKKEFEDQLAAYWLKVKDNQVYIINYGSDKEIERREKLFTDNIKLPCFGGPRVVLVRGGDKYSALTTLWLIPPGATNPNP